MSIRRLLLLLVAVAGVGTQVPTLASASPSGPVDSLLARLPYTGTDTNRVNLLHQLSKAYLGVDDSTAMCYALEELELVKLVGTTRQMGKIHYLIGYIYFQRKNYPQALQHFMQSVQVRQPAVSRSLPGRDSLGLADSYNRVGQVYYETQYYTQAINWYGRALVLQKSLRSLRDVRQSLHNIGLAYRKQGNSRQAVNYYQQALPVARELKDSALIATTINDLGMAYLEGKNYPQAITYFEQMLQLARASRDTLSKARALNNIGYTHFCQQAYPLARKFYRLSLQEHYQSEMLLTYFNLFTLDSLQHQTNAALASLKKIEALAEVLNNREVLLESFVCQAAIYQQRRNWKAVVYQQHYIDLQAVLNQERTANLALLYQNRYQMELVESTLTQQYREAFLARQQENDKTYYWLGFSCLLIITIVLYIIAYPAIKRYGNSFPKNVHDQSIWPPWY